MNKQALVHLHTLFFEVRTYLQSEHGIRSEKFVAYDREAIRPQHIYRGKDAHKQAITLLLTGFSRSIPSAPPPKTLPN